MGRKGTGGGKGSGSRLLVGVLVCLAVGAGGWNYARNSAADASAFRPYAAYSAEDIEALISAYQAEVAAFEQRYDAARNRRTSAANRDHLTARVREFERVQQVGRATREMGARISENRATLRLLREEQERRGADTGPLALFLRRVFVYRP